MNGMLRRGASALLLAGLVLLPACGDQPEPSPTTPAGTGGATTRGPESPGPARPSPSPAEVKLFEFQIADGEASPQLARAEVASGATVRIVVTSDQPDEVHLHGYDLTAEVGPGQEGVLEFVADQIGLFELETHETGLVLLQLQVR